MKRYYCSLILLLCFLNSYSQKGDIAGLYPHSRLSAVEFNEVNIDDDFWNERIRTVQEVTIPFLLDMAEEQGKIDNFRIVAGKKSGKLSIFNAPDSEIYKLIEAAGYSFAYRKNEVLEQRIDSIIGDIADAQSPTGYLHTQYMLTFEHPAAPSPDMRQIKRFGFGIENQWNSVNSKWPFAYNQLYCAGHLMEAGVAYYRGTGKDRLLKVAIKLSDLICSVFTDEKIKRHADHPEVEIGLMKVYEVTGDKKYLDVANKLCRYVSFSRPVDINREENSKPLHEQRKAFGHCVETTYMYTGATDICRATGAKDLIMAVNSLWEDVIGTKMYIHGGIGNGTHDEQHGNSYDLPVLPTYSECCSSIAQGQWNYRLGLFYGKTQYADLVELEMYNSALSGISLDGKSYFYTNKINIGKEKRKSAHSGVRQSYLFCCPSKLPGFITGIGRWVYAKDNNTLYVNQFVGSSVSTMINGRRVSLKQTSAFPWNGNVSFTWNSPATVDLNIRIPQWVNKDAHIAASCYYYSGNRGNVSVKVNGKRAKCLFNADGYLSLHRHWKKGDKVEIAFDMPVHRIYTGSKIKANVGKVALMRGPILYCLEGMDNEFDIEKMQLSASTSIENSYDPMVLGGTNVLTGNGQVQGKDISFKAVPYYLWQNRGIAAMTMLLNEQPDISKEEQPDYENMETNR